MARCVVSLPVTNLPDHRFQAREEGTDLRCRHDIRQAVRPSIPDGLPRFYGVLTRAPFAAGLAALITLAFKAATGSCPNSAGS